MILKLIICCCKERYAELLTLLHFFSGYATCMSKCLEFEAHLQCSTGKSDLICLFYPQAGDTQHFFASSKPCHGVCHTVEHLVCSITLWSTLTLCCSRYNWFMLLRICYHFTFTPYNILESL